MSCYILEDSHLLCVNVLEQKHWEYFAKNKIKQTNKQTKQLLNEVNHNKPRVNMIHFIHLLETNNNSPVWTIVPVSVTIWVRREKMSFEDFKESFFWYYQHIS